MLNVIPRHVEVQSELTAELIQIPIVSQALCLLKEIADHGGIKLTATGRLERAFVKKFWREQISPINKFTFEPHRQDDCPELTKLSFLIGELGWVQTSRGKLSLSKSGQSRVEPHKLETLYEELLECYISTFNWAFEDLHPEFEFIQQNALVLIGSLREWPKPTITPKELFNSHFRYENSAPYPEGFPYKSPEAHATCCLRTRFFDRFAVPFGLLDDLSKDRREFSNKKAYERSAFLRKWIIPVYESEANPTQH